jgi:tyrosinase
MTAVILLQLVGAQRMVAQSPAPVGFVQCLVDPNGKSRSPDGLVQGTPKVEIRINELVGDSTATDITGDDYVTWAPTFCRARLVSPLGSAVNVVLANDAPGAIVDGGEVVFAKNQDSWPANTTANDETLPLELPGDGSWAPFVIAGKFGSPSHNDKDTVIIAHHETSGVEVGSKALMVRVRKNANKLKVPERDRFLEALRKFRKQMNNNYVVFQEMHRLSVRAGDESHSQPAFLGWHRAMLLEVERELQKIDASVSLHYWDWDAAAPNIFSTKFMGSAGSDEGLLSEPHFEETNPLHGWRTDTKYERGKIQRTKSDHAAAPPAYFFVPLVNLLNPANSLVGKVNFGPRDSGAGADAFSGWVESRSHDMGHVWACEAGNLRMRNRSANDPLFYLLHSQVDRQWAYWQQHNTRFGVIVNGALQFPPPAHYDNNGKWNDPGVLTWQKGSFLEDELWPWDGTTGDGNPGPRDDRPPNRADGIDVDNEAESKPVISGAGFPASTIRNIWPSTRRPVKNRHMIDYLGKFRPSDGLGFCYDDVRYQAP